jgi:CRP-like cAMP-binding protein
MIAIMSDSMGELLKSSGGRRHVAGAGEYLFHQGEPVLALFVVLDGIVHLIRHQPDGGAIILQRAGPGDVLAEASLFSNRYHCDGVAMSNATVRSIPKGQLLDRLRKKPDLAVAWAAHLAREVRNARFRTEVLSLKTVAARLDAWLAWQNAAKGRMDAARPSDRYQPRSALSGDGEAAEIARNSMWSRSRIGFSQARLSSQYWPQVADGLLIKMKKTCQSESSLRWLARPQPALPWCCSDWPDNERRTEGTTN